MNTDLKKTVYVLFVAMGLQACAYDNYESLRPEKKCVPDTVSFSRDIVALLNKECNMSGCHAGYRPEGNLNLEASVAYSSLHKKGKGYVDTLDPRSSVLYSSLISVSSPMPPTKRLSDCELKRILKWMEQKAKNN